MEDKKVAEDPPVKVEGEEKPEIAAPIVKEEFKIPNPRDLSYFAGQTDKAEDMRVKMADIQITVPVINKTYK